MAKITPNEIEKHLSGVNYPATKQDLLAEAEEQAASEQLRSLLAQLPDDQYDTPADVTEAISRLE